MDFEAQILEGHTLKIGDQAVTDTTVDPGTWEAICILVNEALRRAYEAGFAAMREQVKDGLGLSRPHERG